MGVLNHQERVWRWGWVGLAALFSMTLSMALQARAAPLKSEKIQLCATCHGENGIPKDPTTPVIWGQNEGYIYLQLRDFESGARKNDLMSFIAGQLTRDEMFALAAHRFGAEWKDWLNAASIQVEELMGISLFPVRLELYKIVESEATVVRRIFESYINGKTPREIAKELNEESVPRLVDGIGVHPPSTGIDSG